MVLKKQQGPQWDPVRHQAQVRWKRKDGYSRFYEPRGPTKKQRKKFHRKKALQQWQKEGRHSAPGSVAGKRREFEAEQLQEYLDWDETKIKQGLLNPNPKEYEYGDALLDDLMGNTSHLTSTPTPEPKYMGGQHAYHYNRVAQLLSTSTSKPSDHDISLVIRSYRDRHGSRSNPIGIVKALQHVLQDLQIPSTQLFGELTYTSLLTCCKTPKEALRIFKLMRDHQHPPSAYAFSILIHIHARLGDYQACEEVMKEMVLETGQHPPLAAYTSLLSACFKVCNNGRIPHTIRHKAGTLAWQKWKELRIIGLEPDIMCYGAILRICEARGHAERAMNFLEEIALNPELKPTTLVFTSALKAVAKSHQITNRYQNGKSPRDKKRERVTAHHGNMARDVVIQAENAEVELDNGFVAALILCAGAAGDSATAKSIVLAHQVRRMDHLRTIGSDQHLDRLRGVNNSDSLLLGAEQNGELKASTGGGTTGLITALQQEEDSFQRREYGSDDGRILSALMTACSQAMEYKLGSIWQGRDNKGYLCHNSLRFIQQRPQPEYKDNSIPGVSDRQVGLGSMLWEEDGVDKMSKRLRRKKFEGVDIDGEGTDMDTLEEYFYDMYKDDEEQKEDKDHAIHSEIRQAKLLKAQGIKQLPEQVPVVEDTPSIDDDGLSGHKFFFDATSGQVTELNAEPSQQQPTQLQQQEEPSEEWYFDQNNMQWKTRPFVSKKKEQPHSSSIQEAEFTETQQEDEEEFYFDTDEMKWKTRQKQHQPTKPSLSEYEASVLARNTELEQDDGGESHLNVSVSYSLSID